MTPKLPKENEEHFDDLTEEEEEMLFDLLFGKIPLKQKEEKDEAQIRSN